jgi:hypothetical protein
MTLTQTQTETEGESDEMDAPDNQPQPQAQPHPPGRRPLNIDLLQAIAEALERKRPDGAIPAEVWAEVKNIPGVTRRMVNQMLAAQAKRGASKGPASDVLGNRRIKRNSDGEYVIIHTRVVKHRRRPASTVDDDEAIDNGGPLDKGAQLEVLMTSGDEAIVKASDGHVYRILWERVS